jgi:hypothetical protein
MTTGILGTVKDVRQNICYASQNTVMNIKQGRTPKEGGLEAYCHTAASCLQPHALAAMQGLAWGGGQVAWKHKTGRLIVD